DSENQWRTQRECTRRGIFALGPTTLRSGDPFGLYTVTISYAAATTLVVMPPIVDLPTIEVAPGGRVGEGRQRADAFERTISVAGVRDYVSGDSMTRIHWPTSLRHDALYVRL